MIFGLPNPSLKLLASTTTASTNTWQRASVSFAVAGGAPAQAQLPITLLFDIADAADSFGAYIDNVILLPVDIEPDANMAGVVGDVVKSVVAGSPIKHFVSPKKSTELAQDYVILKATGITADQITPGHASKVVEWDGGEAMVPADYLKRRVSRSASGSGPTEVKIRIKGGGVVVQQMDVWVVWTTVTPTAGTATFGKPAGYSDWRVSAAGNAGWRFKFVIQPSSIISGVAERPDLTGIPTKPVPGAGKPFTTDPTAGDGDSALFKWDTSRQISISIRNPGLIAKADFVNFTPAAWSVNQPVALDTPIPFPTDSVEGNDDLNDGSEESNPYQASTANGLAHAVGEMSTFDAPGWGIVNSVGVNGRTYSAKANFHEFARLEIWDGKRNSGKYWFKISDNVDWHHAFLTTFSNPPPMWNNNGSSAATGSVAP
jgi:hypothetical protein